VLLVRSRGTVVPGLKRELKMIKNILVAAAFGAVALGAHATAPAPASATNLVLNGQMDGSTGDYIYNAPPASVTTFYGPVPTEAGTVADWTGSFVSIAANSSPWGTPSSLAGFNASFGGYIAGVQADGTLSQDLTLAAGTYVLTWSDANRGANQTYSVDFGGDKLGTFNTVAGAGWHTESIVFTTDGATGLSFVGGTSFGDTDATSFIDKVSVMAVPEPSSMLMMAVATLGLLAWRRRTQA
jgi:hypothetical protein